MTEWIRYRPDVRSGPGFSLEHPADWRVGPVEGSSAIQFVSPDDAAFVYLTAFAKPGGTLEDFAAFRFAVQAETFAPVGPAVELHGTGWRGLLQEAEDQEKARRVLLCANSGDVFVTLSLYTASADYLARRSHYGRFFTSLAFEGAPAVPEVADLATLLAGFALGHAAWSASELRAGETLAPIAIVLRGAERELVRFEDGLEEDRIAEARAAMAEAMEAGHAWALAHAGHVTVQATKVDALVVTCWSPGMAAGAVALVQPIESLAARGRFRVVGDPHLFVRGRAQSPEAAEPTLRKLREGVLSHPKAGALWGAWSEA